jgi:hypothetical protein
VLNSKSFARAFAIFHEASPEHRSFIATFTADRLLGIQSLAGSIRLIGIEWQDRSLPKAGPTACSGAFGGEAMCWDKFHLSGNATNQDLRQHYVIVI